MTREVLCLSQIARRIVLALAVFGFTAVTPTLASAQPESDAPKTPEAVSSISAEKLGAEVNSLLAEPVKRNAFSGTVMVARSGTVLVNQGFGIANHDYKIPCGGETAYRIGSMTKQFTAMAIFILREQKKVSLEDKVTKFLPFLKNFDSVTVHDLLTHSSGIPSYTSLKFFPKIKRQALNLPQLVRKLTEYKLLFPAGSKFQYSNSNYAILTGIIEVITKARYQKFFRDSIFKPLKLKNTGFDSHHRIIPKRASGYMFNGSVFYGADFTDMNIPNGAGAMFSTTTDLLVWCKAVIENKLISSESTQLMLTPRHSGFACGWIVSGEGEDRWVSHGGAIDGFRSNIRFCKSKDLLIIVLANLEQARSGEIAAKVAKLAEGKSVKAFKFHDEIKLDLEMAKRISGTYVLTPRFAIKMFVKDNQLFTQATNQPALRVYQSGPHEFFLKTPKASLVFKFPKNSKSATPKPTELVLNQNGRKVVLKRSISQSESKNKPETDSDSQEF